MECFANNRLRLSVTSACNFKCKYCSNEGQPCNSKEYIDFDLLKNIFKKIKEEEIYIRKLNLTGGEPLIHKNLLDIIKLGVRHSEMVTLNTNGSLLDRNIIKELANIGLHNLKFGIDNFFSDHTKYTGSLMKSKTKDKIIDNFFFAKELMPRTSINLVLTDFNKIDIHRILNYIIDNKIDKVELLELISHDFRKTGDSLHFNSIYDILLSTKDLFETISYNSQLAKYICYTKSGIAIQFAEDFCNRRVCQDLWTRINCNGELLPCIKEGKGIKIDFAKPLSQQIVNCNLLMCSGSKGMIPRDYNGNINGLQNAYNKPEQLNNEFIITSNEDL